MAGPLFPSSTLDSLSSLRTRLPFTTFQLKSSSHLED